MAGTLPTYFTRAGLPSGGTPYGYSQFCDLYSDFRQRADLSMRQVHRAG